MKKYLFIIVLSLTAFAIVSCDLKSRSTPMFYGSTTVVRTTAAGVTDTISYLDTLNVGDTVRMSYALDGVLNYLTQFQVGSDTTEVKTFIPKDWNEESDAYLGTGSDPEHGRLVFLPGKVSIWLCHVCYIPRKSGTHIINLYLSSDAGENYSPRTGTLEIKVR